VWGGTLSDVTGGRYNPANDTWLPTSLGSNVPSLAPSFATSVWSGSHVIIWGGYTFAPVSSGVLYDPVADTWTPTSTGANCPSARYHHAAVWTGSEMVVWGGGTASNDAAGGRYDPLSNGWTATSLSDVPLPRSRTASVWTGSELIVWGGFSPTATGGRYCACLDPLTSYRDLDGDGYGDAANMTFTCDGAPPAGYVANPSDCNDASAAAHPGAAEICDGLDNDCNDQTDDAPVPASVPSLTLSKPAAGTARLNGAYAGSDHTACDIVKGSLGALLAGGGNFAPATSTCLADDTATPIADDAAPLDPGAGFWYLMRAVNCGGNGTYDTGAPSQAGSRDAEIAASGADFCERIEDPAPAASPAAPERGRTEASEREGAVEPALCAFRNPCSGRD